MAQNKPTLTVVRISEGGLRAEVTVGDGTADQCIEALTTAGVKMDEARCAAVMAAVARGDGKVLFVGRAG